MRIPPQRGRTRSVPRVDARAVLAALLCGAGAAHGGSNNDSHEFWPELNVYYGIDERSRLLFTAAAARAMEGASDAGKTTFQDGQFTLNFDYTLAPILRRDVPAAEWSKNRLLWARVGFDYGTSFTSGPDSFRSYTGVVEMTSRFPLADDVWFHNRLRVDFRNVNGEPSQRYRVRIGVEGQTTVLEHPLSPYTNVETLYDTRYDRWSRLTWKLGAETPIGGAWRLEPYLAWQFNRPDDSISRVVALGLTFKVYQP
jgi:hypothetical protein